MKARASDSGNDLDSRAKNEAKAKRLYIRQKAFDKYSFQLSIEDLTTEEGSSNNANQGAVMNRTDSEKLDDKRLSASGGTGKAKILTNEVSTDEPEVSIKNNRKLTIVILFVSELCKGKAMVAHTKPQQGKKEESERLRRERDQIKFIDLRFERWQFVRSRKARRRQEVP